MWVCPYRKGKLGHRENRGAEQENDVKTQGEHTRKPRSAWDYQKLGGRPGTDPASQLSEGTGCAADTSASDFWPPDLSESECLLRGPPGFVALCYGSRRKQRQIHVPNSRLLAAHSAMESPWQSVGHRSRVQAALLSRQLPGLVLDHLTQREILLKFARAKQLGGRICSKHSHIALGSQTNSILVIAPHEESSDPNHPNRIKGWFHFISFQENLA